jgi:predicted nucleotidyltransferase
MMRIQENITAFFEHEKNIVAVYLFGSYAGGRERASSDVDMAILFGNRDRGIVNQMLDKYLVAISRNLRKDIHLIAMDFAGEELLKQIFKIGICLVVNDAKKLAYFKMNALTKIVNFQYYKKQMQSGVVRKVIERI